MVILICAYISMYALCMYKRIFTRVDTHTHIYIYMFYIIMKDRNRASNRPGRYLSHEPDTFRVYLASLIYILYKILS